jgi:dTDP-4-dehydrorhamnose 3,5-epimerase
MNLVNTGIEGLFVLEPRVFKDDRGYFFESYNEAVFDKLGLKYNFVQDNQSFSLYGTVRGIHFQRGEHAQAKLVRCLAGSVLDVAVDLRKDSPTFGKHFSVELTDQNHKMLLLPRGFGHGFSVLSETAIFFYKCDNFYNKESEGAINYADPELAIDWKIDLARVAVSEKDMIAPLFEGVKCTL